MALKMITSLTRDNWAFLLKDGKLEWFFGHESFQQIKDFLINLATALNNFGEDFLGEGIGLFQLTSPVSNFERQIQVLVIRLGKNIYFVCANPEVTARLLEKEGIPPLIHDQLNGVLIGAAVQQYARFWSSNLYSPYRDKIDQLFMECIELLDAKDRVILGEGEISLAKLSLYELILLHLYLRLNMERDPVFHSKQKWALVMEDAGSPIYLHWNLDDFATSALSGLISAMCIFAKISLGATLEGLSFGVSQITKLYILEHKEKILALTHPELVLSDERFQQLFQKMPMNVQQALIPVLKPLLLEIIVGQIKREYEVLDLQKLYELVRLREKRKKFNFSSHLTQINELLQKTSKFFATTNVNDSVIRPIRILYISAFTEEVIEHLNDLLVDKKEFSQMFQEKNTFSILYGTYNFQNVALIPLEIELAPSNFLKSKPPDLWAKILNISGLIIDSPLDRMQQLAKLNTLIDELWDASGKATLPTLINFYESYFDAHLQQKKDLSEYEWSIESYVGKKLDMESIMGIFSYSINRSQVKFLLDGLIALVLKNRIKELEKD